MKEKILNTKLLPGQAALFYTGQLGFIVKCNDKYILIDGYLTDSIDRRNGNVPEWTRRYAVPIAPCELDFIDYVFCSHDHQDHADPETLGEIVKVNKKTKYVVSKGIAEAMVSYGVDRKDIVGMECDKRTVLEDGFAVTAIPAAHEELHLNQELSVAGEKVYQEVGFLMEIGDIRLYHSGDCCPYDGLEERVQGCDIMILPVNGRDYYRRYVHDIIGCFDCKEAVLLAKHTGAKLLIPAHIDLYEGNCLNPAVFVDCLNTNNPMQAFHIFAPGERFIYSN